MTYSGTIDLSSSDDKLVDIPITNGVCVTAMHIYANRPGCYIKDFNTNSDIYAQIGDIGDGRWYLWADLVYGLQISVSYFTNGVDHAIKPVLYSKYPNGGGHSMAYDKVTINELKAARTLNGVVKSVTYSFDVEPYYEKITGNATAIL